MKNTFYIFMLGVIIAGAWSGIGQRDRYIVSANPRAVKVKKLPVKPTPKYVGIEAKIAKAFPNNSKEMIAIARCESGLDATKINHGDSKLSETGCPSYGLFQINGCNLPNWDDPDTNIQYAVQKFNNHETWQGSGYFAWFNCSKKLGLL